LNRASSIASWRTWLSRAAFADDTTPYEGTTRVDPSEVRTPQTYRVRDIALIATLLGVVSTIFDFTFFALYFRISPAVLQTNWFIASIVTELVFLFSIRTRRFFLAANRPATILLALTALGFSLTLVLPYTGFGQTVFHFTPPTAFHLATILGLAALYFVATETVKLLYYRFLDGRKEKAPSGA